MPCCRASYTYHLRAAINIHLFIYLFILDLVFSYSFKLRRLIFCVQCNIVKTINTFQTAAPSLSFCAHAYCGESYCAGSHRLHVGLKFQLSSTAVLYWLASAKRQIFPLFRELKEDLMIKSVDISVHIIFCAYRHLAVII